MEFSKQEYWSGLPYPPPGDLPNPGNEPSSLHLLHLLHGQAGSSPLEPPGKPIPHLTTPYKNCKDLTEAEEIKKTWQEYTEELYTKGLNDPDNHYSVFTHLEPDILEYVIKGALGSITMNKASGTDGIPTELFKVLKYNAVKVLHSVHQQIWKTQQWPQD